MTEPVAEGPGFELRALDIAYFPQLHHIANDPANRLTWRTRGRYWSGAEFEARVADGPLPLVICDSDNPARVLGLVELMDVQLVDAKAHLSIVLDPSVHRSGLGARVAAVFAQYVFANHRIDKLAVSCLDINSALLDGLERRLSAEGVARREVCVDGKWFDVHSFALFRDEHAELLAVPDDGLPDLPEWVAEVDPATPIIELDSLSVLELVVFVEERRGRELAVGAYLDGTVADLLSFAT